MTAPVVGFRAYTVLPATEENVSMYSVPRASNTGAPNTPARCRRIRERRRGRGGGEGGEGGGVSENKKSM